METLIFTLVISASCLAGYFVASLTGAKKVTGLQLLKNLAEQKNIELTHRCHQLEL